MIPSCWSAMTVSTMMICEYEYEHEHEHELKGGAGWDGLPDRTATQRNSRTDVDESKTRNPWAPHM